ncbi:MAG: hypothetical protein ACRBFS_21320 [Aureispira sp.]
MNILEEIDEELFQDNIDTEIKKDSLYWIDNFKASNKIYKSQTAVNGNRIAWWQINEVGKDIVKIKLSNDLTICWRPDLNTMGQESQGCNFIEFCQEVLVVKYQDKHRERVFLFNIDHLESKEISTHSRDLTLKMNGKKLVFQSRYDRDKKATYHIDASRWNQLETKVNIV